MTTTAARATEPAHPATTEPTRADARRLAGQGLSGRAIARQLGVGQTTVRRWLAEATAADTVTVTLDQDLRDDLEVLAAAGLGDCAGSAVLNAVRLLADAYRTAWDYGHIDRGARGHVCIAAPDPALVLAAAHEKSDSNRTVHRLSPPPADPRRTITA